MPNRRHYRGPRRPGEGAPAEGGAPQPRPFGEGGAPPPSRSFAEGDTPSGEGQRTGRRRRRGRGGRGGGLGSGAPGVTAEGASAPFTDRPAFPEGGQRFDDGGPRPNTGGDRQPLGEGDEQRRRRRRRSRGRGGEPRPLEAGAPPDYETPEGEVPADYIPLQVEHGTAFFFEPKTTSLEVVEQPEPQDRTPQRSKRVNSGKLFWYIRSKSYVPIPELRRRFEITPDEMGTIQDNGQKVYIGVPQDVADVVANLRRQQKIGLECSVDFSTPVVIGVYPLSR